MAGARLSAEVCGLLAGVGRQCPRPNPSAAERSILVGDNLSILDNMSSKAVVDFSKILSSGLGKETAAQLVSFRKRSEDAKRALGSLKSVPTTVDLSQYKNVLNVSICGAASVLLAA